MGLHLYNCHFPGNVTAVNNFRKKNPIYHKIGCLPKSFLIFKNKLFKCDRYDFKKYNYDG